MTEVFVRFQVIRTHATRLDLLIHYSRIHSDHSTMSVIIQTPPQTPREKMRDMRVGWHRIVMTEPEYIYIYIYMGDLHMKQSLLSVMCMRANSPITITTNNEGC